MRSHMLIALVAAGCTTEASLGNTRRPIDPDAFTAPRWAVPIPGKGTSIAFGADSRVIVVGPIVTPLETPVGCRGFITARAHTGTELWTIVLGATDAAVSSVNRVSIDSNGDVVVAGTFRGTIDFGGDTRSTLPTPQTELRDAPRHAFVARYRSDGELVWVRDGFDTGFGMRSFALGPDGTSYVGGQYIRAYSSQGQLSWEQAFTPNTSVEHLLVLPDGDLIAFGATLSGESVGGPPLMIPDNLRRPFLARYGSDGAHRWSMIPESSLEAHRVDAGGLALADDRLVVTRVEHVLAWGSFGFLERYDLAGNLESSTRVRFAEWSAPAVTPFGIVVGGFVNGWATDIGGATVEGPMLLVAYDRAGEPVDVWSFGVKDFPRTPTVHAVAAGPVGEIAFTAGLVTPTDFGTGAIVPPNDYLDSSAIVLLAPPEQ